MCHDEPRLIQVRDIATGSFAGVVADAHLVLSDYGVKKCRHADFDPVQAAQIYAQTVLPAAQALAVLPVRDAGATPLQGQQPAGTSSAFAV